jgi:histidyl-tRNA synthetase
MIKELRNNQIRSEFYPESTKMKKQFSYANAKEIPFLFVMGSDELATKTFVLKNMETGIQTSYPINDFLEVIKNELNS